MAQESNTSQPTAQEHSLQLACGPREQLHVEVTVRWVRHPTESGIGEGDQTQGSDPGPPQEKQPGGNSLRASHLPFLETSSDETTVQHQRMTVVCGPDEAVEFRQWIDVTSRATGDEGATVQSRGTDPGNQGSKQPGGNPLRA